MDKIRNPESKLSTVFPDLSTISMTSILFLRSGRTPAVRCLHARSNGRRRSLLRIPGKPNQQEDQQARRDEETNRAAEAIRMPFGTQRLQDRVGHWSPAFLALGREAIGVAVDAPGVAFPFHKRFRGIKGLRASQLGFVPDRITQERQRTSPH